MSTLGVETVNFVIGIPKKMLCLCKQVPQRVIELQMLPQLEHGCLWDVPKIRILMPPNLHVTRYKGRERVYIDTAATTAVDTPL